MNHLLKITFLITILLALFIVSAPQVLAVDYLPLVPCGRSDQDNPNTPVIEGACTRCDSFKLAHNVISFILYGLVPPVAAVLFIAGGLMILLAGAYPAWIATGKKIFWNTFIGLLIILASWLIVNTFIQSFGPDQVKGSWFKFTCPPITGPGGAGGPPAGQINACIQCPAYPGRITAGGRPVQCTGLYVNTNQPLNNSARTCPFSDALVAQNLVLLRRISRNWVLSEGFPPTVNHADTCHGNGSCVDIALSPRPSDTGQLIQQLNVLCNAVVQAGFPRSKIINEYSSLSGFWPAGPTACPAPTSTPLQTGDHLHIER